jgi:glycerol-3-phosphate acyltransferase PlsY
MGLDVIWRLGLVVVVAYLVGGLPFGVIVARFVYKTDITKLGSGNTGATNVFRTLGWRAALPVALLDIAKGAVPAAIARFLLTDPLWGTNGRDLLVVVAGVAAMLGHMYSPYFKLRGGKGIATAGGAILILMPKAFPVLLIVFVGTILLSRIVSVASIVTALIFPLDIWVIYPQRPVLLVFALIAVPLVLWAHRSNAVRLMHHEEPRITMGRSTRGPGDGTTDPGERKDD